MKGHTRSRGRLVLVILVISLLTGLSYAQAASVTYLQGHATRDTGESAPAMTVKLDLESDLASITTQTGFFVLGGLIDGGRDRVVLAGDVFVAYLVPTFYAGIEPITGQEHLVVQTTSLDEWATAFDSDGTLDDTKGVVYGEVVDAAGAPVSGATVTISPGIGDVFYFDDDGIPAPLAAATGATGRYLILDVVPGMVAVSAHIGKSLLGRAYGRVAEGTVTGLILRPTGTVSGTVTDETGAGVPGALVAWDFDTDFATFTDAGGKFTLTGLADGLDMTLEVSKSGHRPGLSFRRSRPELFDPTAVGIVLLSEGAFATYQSQFGIVQIPSLGMIVGRVLDADGLPLAGAVVSSDPAVGSVRYFNALGQPAPGLTQTSASGQFIIFNVPSGNVVLSAVGPGATIRSDVAPSEAGVVTSGELRGLPRITVRGKIRDEVFRSATIGGAVVSLVEYPYIATIAGVDGSYTLPGVPAEEFVTFRVERSGFKNSYSFTQKSPADDVLCLDTEGRSDCKDFFIISDTAYVNLFLNAKLIANRSQGLISAGVYFSNDEPALGLETAITPQSGSLQYLTSRRGSSTQITSIGAVQVFNATPSIAGLVVFDPRWDLSTVVFVRVVADAATLTDRLHVACDTHTSGVFANIYPCDGAQMTARAKDAFFQWDKGFRCELAPAQSCAVTGIGTDDCGANGPCGRFGSLRSQVQISTDPTFATISLTSANDNGRFITAQSWHANARKWKKVRKLGEPGTPVYWRVLERDSDNTETFTEPFVFYLP